MSNRTEHTVGSFMTNNCIIVTDPCYNYDSRQIIDNALPGEWIANIVRSDEGAWGNRVAELIVMNVDSNYNEYDWVRNRDIEVGVDSGQAGFFNSFLYPRGDTGEYDDKDSFYGKVCKLTVDKNGHGTAGVLAFGAVASSGYGDGGYDLYTVTKNDKVVAAKIVFIGEEEYEDEYELEVVED